MRTNNNPHSHDRPVNPWLVVLAVLLSLSTGCASTASSKMGTSDPFEKINRGIYDLNDFLDRKVGKPVADAYVKITPRPVREGISNFYDNLSYPNVLANDLLQGKFKQGLSDTGRFLVNSTVGVAGLFDVATAWGLEQHNEDFGQTLGVWGLGEGPYLVLPAVGPNTARDAPNLVAKSVTNLFFYVGTFVVAAPVAVVGFIDQRARADKAIRSRDELAVEPYLFTREAYLQHRTYLIYDGNPPLPDMLQEEMLVEVEDVQEPSPPASNAELRPAHSARTAAGASVNGASSTGDLDSGSPVPFEQPAEP